MSNYWLPDEEVWRLMTWQGEIEPEPLGGLHGQAAEVGGGSTCTPSGQIATPVQQQPGFDTNDPSTATADNHQASFVCTHSGCTNTYGRQSELSRHVREKHVNESGRFLCPIDLCPRSIPGEGFDRMCHLTAHLRNKSLGHNMDKIRAKYEARKANPQKNGAKKE